MGGSALRNSTGDLIQDEEQRLRRLEKKEIERIARRFKVITPAEFERNMSMSGQATGIERNGRQASDSWCGNNQAAATN